MTARRLFHLTWIALSLACPAVSFPQSGRVWILNSDRGVERYRLNHDAFKETWGEPVVDIDLGRLRLDAFEVARRAAVTPPSAVYCIGSKAYIIASQLLPDQQIVLSSAINWQRLPIARNRLVVTTEMGIDAQLTLFRYFFPDVRRIGLICSRAYNHESAIAASHTAEEMNLVIVFRLVDQESDVTAALEDVLPAVDALWVIPDPIVLSGSAETRRLIARAEAAGVPVFSFSLSLLEMGATLAIAPDDATIGRQSAELLRRAGAPAGSEAVNPAGSTIGLNLRMIEKLRLRLNEAALDSVDRLIR